MTGRKRKYCAPTCRSSYVEPKRAGLDDCQFCGNPIATQKKAGRPRRNCSDECRRAIRTQQLRDKRQSFHKCELCETKFQSGKKKQRWCSKVCRTIGQAEDVRLKRESKIASLYPDGIRTEPCKWCGEPRSFDYRTGAVNGYHEHCRKEAQSARYRIKTVKRQKLTSRYRISHEEIVRQYGDKCHICNDLIDLKLPRTHRFGLTVDHLVPISRGGGDDMSNLRPAHWICNIRKSNKPLESINA